MYVSSSLSNKQHYAYLHIGFGRALPLSLGGQTVFNAGRGHAWLDWRYTTEGHYLFRHTATRTRCTLRDNAPPAAHSTTPRCCGNTLHRAFCGEGAGQGWATTPTPRLPLPFLPACTSTHTPLFSPPYPTSTGRGWALTHAPPRHLPTCFPRLDKNRTSIHNLLRNNLDTVAGQVGTPASHLDM